MFCIPFQDHTRFANCVRYAPNGEVFISGGADGKVSIEMTCAIIKQFWQKCFNGYVNQSWVAAFVNAMEINKQLKNSQD